MKDKYFSALTGSLRTCHRTSRNTPIYYDQSDPIAKYLHDNPCFTIAIILIIMIIGDLWICSADLGDEIFPICMATLLLILWKTKCMKKNNRRK